MSVVQQAAQAPIQGIRTNNLNQGQLGNRGLGNRNAPAGGGGGFGGDNVANAIDTTEYIPSELASTSSLMGHEVQCRNYPATCWFEPLGYCSDGLNRNGWCSWHLHHLFNAQSASEPETVYNNGRIEIVKYQRMLTFLPMPLNPALVRVFPIIETYESLDDLERNLNFGLFVYTLRHSARRSDEEVNRIVAEHKVYFMLMMEAMTSNAQASRRNVVIDPIIRINTAACVDYISENLYNKQYNMHLILTVPANGAAPSTIQHLDVRRCSTLTQSIVTMFELPFGFSAELNLCLASPAAFMVAGNDLVCDESKMSHGTFALNDGKQTFGTPCTLSIFRTDTAGDMSFYSSNYSRSSERCLQSHVDRKKLLDYVNPQPGLPAIEAAGVGGQV
jgi:hypothetical protein